MRKSLEYVLEFTPSAREDIREIVLWYRMKSKVCRIGSCSV